MLGIGDTFALDSQSIIRDMRIVSTAFEHNTFLPKAYSCDGAGVNPPLTFEEVPDEAKSLVLIVDDPDAPHGTFVHWVLYNIPAETAGIEENALPNGAVQGLSGTGKPGFVAACPPSGQHRYFFKLYALNTVIEQEGLTKQAVEQVMDGHILAHAELIGLYARSSN